MKTLLLNYSTKFNIKLYSWLTAIVGLALIFTFFLTTQQNKLLPQRIEQTKINQGSAPLIQKNWAANIQPNEVSTASFLAVGDIMLSRNVAAKIKKANDPLLPFKTSKKLLLSTDFNFGNLESPFSGQDKFSPSPTLTFNAPRANIQGLKEFNFKVLSLANNHAVDQGLKGLIYTRQYLLNNNIQGIGTGANLDEAWKPAIIEIKGIKIGFLAASYASLNDNAKKKTNYVARFENIDRLQSAINSLKSQVDFIVVSMHGGTEYTYKANQTQSDFAHTAIEAGADLIIGHHPHWVQEIEIYQGKYIFYSLGNFIFDQMWSRETHEGLAIKISLIKNNDTKLSQLELIPIVIDNFSTPRLATGAESEKILKHINVTNPIFKP